jgi:hypothetical protein
MNIRGDPLVSTERASVKQVNVFKTFFGKGNVGYTSANPPSRRNDNRPINQFILSPLVYTEPA